VPPRINRIPGEYRIPKCSPARGPCSSVPMTRPFLMESFASSYARHWAGTTVDRAVLRPRATLLARVIQAPVREKFSDS